ncbi:MAG: GyrI-like domain-containing protein [Polyangiaceae bacterium]
MKDETRSAYETAVRRAVEQIVARLDQALDLAQLAKAAALSPLHFHRIFRGALGETPLELHRRLRLERAAHGLSHGDEPVTRIAFEAGYETHESFTRRFGERYGVSPSQFRQNAGKARSSCERPAPIELAARSGLHFRPGLTASSILLTLASGDPNMQIEIKQLPALRVAAVRHVGPYNRISEAFERLGRIAGMAGLIRPPSTQMLALYHDDPDATAPDALRSDAAVSVPEDAQLPPELSELRIPAGSYATMTHLGPYSGLGDAWSRLMGAWLPGSGRRLGAGPSFEIYRNTPLDTPAEKLRTELYVSVE